MSSLALVALAAATLQSATSATGPQDRSAEAAVPLADVLVEGRRTAASMEAAETFVDEVSTRPFGALTLGRWEAPVCPEILNLEGEKPAIILRIIRARAAQAGAPVGGDGCRPNVSIVMTADGSATATDFVDFAPKAFRISPSRTQGSRAELRRFKESDAPIRWWHTSGLYDTRHRAFISTSGSTPSVVNTDGHVYFNQNRRQAFLSVLIIVDVSRLRSVDLGALADYLAFVMLAEVEPPPARPSFPSILNLRQDGAGVDALTTWDTGYLRGLYAADVRVSGSGTAVETGYQQSEIARSVLNSVRGESPGE